MLRLRNLSFYSIPNGQTMLDVTDNETFEKMRAQITNSDSALIRPISGSCQVLIIYLLLIYLF